MPVSLRVNTKSRQRPNLFLCVLCDPLPCYLAQSSLRHDVMSSILNGLIITFFAPFLTAFVSYPRSANEFDNTFRYPSSSSIINIRFVIMERPASLFSQKQTVICHATFISSSPLNTLFSKATPVPIKIKNAWIVPSVFCLMSYK